MAHGIKALLFDEGIIFTAWIPSASAPAFNPSLSIRDLMIDCSSLPGIKRLAFLKRSFLLDPVKLVGLLPSGVFNEWGVAKVASSGSGFNLASVPQIIVKLNMQEYVDHQSTIFKFCVLGDQVFFSTRKSTPDASVLLSKASGAPVVLFDISLKFPDLMAMKEAAATLRDHLGLTIMGFDVVIQSGTQDHVIVDIQLFSDIQ